MKGNKKLITYGLFCALMVVLHRPLPFNFTDTLLDRFIMYNVEFLLRCLYVYPTRLCSDSMCELIWTRAALAKLMLAVGPWTSEDPEITIKNFKVDHIPARVYIPFNRSSDGAIIYIHGGGFVLGTMDMYESFIRQVVKNTRMTVFSMDYRLAPEHAFPAALDDCEHMVLEVLRRAYDKYGINRNRIALMGDSAGGGLIASLSYRLRYRRDIIQPKVQILIYPLVQVHNLRTPSYEYFYRVMAGTGFIEPRLIAQYYLMYAGVEGKLNEQMTRLVLDNEHLSQQARVSIQPYVDLRLVPPSFRYGRNITLWQQKYDERTSRRLIPFLLNPEFSPLVQPDLHGVPSALVVTMEHDILRDEGILYAQRLIQAGIPTTWKHFGTGFHAMLNFHNIIPSSERVVKYISDWALNHI